MRTVGRVLVIVLAVSLVTSAASAGGTFPPSAFRLSVGEITAGDPVPALASDDDGYLDIGAKRDGNVRKVTYKTTHSSLPTDDNTLGLDWAGQTNLKHSCDMTFSVQVVRSKKWVLVGTDTITEGPTDDFLSHQLPGDSDARFVSAGGTAKAKVSCKDDSTFTLKTDRFRLTS